MIARALWLLEDDVLLLCVRQKDKDDPYRHSPRDGPTAAFECGVNIFFFSRVFQRFFIFLMEFESRRNLNSA